MAADFKFTALRKNEALDAIRDNFNNGYLRIYSGTRPATPDTALSGNTLLAELRFNATAFPAASGGVLTANAMTADTSADNTGTASFYRAFESDGTTVICDGNVGTASADLILGTVSINAGVQVSISSFTITA